MPVFLLVLVPGRGGNRTLGSSLHHDQLVRIVGSSVVKQQVLNRSLLDLITHNGAVSKKHTQREIKRGSQKWPAESGHGCY